MHENDKFTLNTKGLFVFGAARSGTSITIDLLNGCKEALLFAELEFALLQSKPDTFECYGGQSPLEHFVSKHAAFGTDTNAKGYHIPHNIAAEFGGQFWTAAAMDRQYTGEKVAMLHNEVSGHFLFEDTISWHITHAPLARYLLCVRDPAQIALSAAAKWGHGGEALVRYLIVSTERLMEMWRILPNARLLTHHRWTLDAQASLGKWLDLPIRPDPAIKPADRVRAEGYPEQLAPHAEILEDMSRAYCKCIALLPDDDNAFPFVFRRDVHDGILEACRLARHGLWRACYPAAQLRPNYAAV